MPQRLRRGHRYRRDDDQQADQAEDYQRMAVQSRTCPQGQVFETHKEPHAGTQLYAWESFMMRGEMNEGDMFGSTA